MQTEKVILIPPTHEQSTPSFHVEGGLKDEFLAFLAQQGITAWQPPETLEKRGADAHRVVEIEIEADTPTEYLEGLVDQFLAGRDA